MAFALPVIMGDSQKKIWECMHIFVVIPPAGEEIINVEMYICSFPEVMSIPENQECPEYVLNPVCRRRTHAA
jgi:hypothetical protein